MSELVAEVEQFKDSAKELIKQCKLRTATEFVSGRYDALTQEEPQLREEVTLVHWWCKAYLEALDLRNLTTKCLTKVNTMINTI